MKSWCPNVYRYDILYCVINTISHLIKHIDYNVRLILMSLVCDITTVILRCVVLAHSRDTCTVDNVTVGLRRRHVLTTLLQL